MRKGSFHGSFLQSEVVVFAAGSCRSADSWQETERDKAYSFTDCTSFVVMQELKLKTALTTDRHFRQMGMDIVPRVVRRG